MFRYLAIAALAAAALAPSVSRADTSAARVASAVDGVFTLRKMPPDGPSKPPKPKFDGRDRTVDVTLRIKEPKPPKPPKPKFDGRDSGGFSSLLV